MKISKIIDCTVDSVQLVDRGESGQFYDISFVGHTRMLKIPVDRAYDRKDNVVTNDLKITPIPTPGDGE